MNAPHHPTISLPSLMRFHATRDNQVLGKAKGFHELWEAILSNRLFTFRNVCSDRTRSKVLVESGSGERRWCLDCASNNYLAMSGDPRVVQAVAEAVQRFGSGAQGASMLNGNTPIHMELEEALARFLGREAVALSPSGYASQIACMQGLLRTTDVVFYDQFCHFSLLDGMRLSGAKMHQYPHLDMGALREMLGSQRSSYGGAMIVTDGVFSSEGTVAPVAELVALAREFSAALVVDDAHALGTTNRGRGSSVFMGVDIITGTLSKSLGSGGGFISGPRDAIDYLRLFGTATCATTNLSVANAAASLAALRIIEANPDLPEDLSRKAAHFRRRLAQKGIPTPGSCGPVISLVCGKDVAAYSAWQSLFSSGILAHALPFPIVARGKARIRVRLNVGLDYPELDYVADSLAAIPEIQRTP